MADVFSAEAIAQAREIVATTRAEISDVKLRLGDSQTADRSRELMRVKLGWLRKVLEVW